MKHTLINFTTLLTRYFPAYVVSFVLLLIFRQSLGAFLLTTLFFVLQIAYILLIDRFPGSVFEKANLDFAPPAAIVLAYYVSLPSALICAALVMIIFDIYSLEVSVFSETEDAVFTLIIAVAAALLRGVDFLSLAVALVFVRYFVLTIVHGFLTRDFNPRKFFLEGTGALVFIFIFRLIGMLVGA